MEVLSGIWKKLINNIGLKLLSLAMGALIWVIVVGIDNPVKTQVFNAIPINVENAEFMEKEGKFFEVAESSRTVSVTVRAERTVLDQLSRDNFSASINLEEYNDGRVPINVRATRYSDRISSITPRTAYAMVTVEDLGQKQIGIEPEITGEVPEGYSVGNAVVNNNVVKISGPESIVGSIEKAVVRVSVQGMTRDIRTDSAIIFYDSDGEALSTANLDLSRTDASITVEIWKNKVVPVSYGYTGIPADGYAATGNIMATINELTVTGSRNALNNFEELSIPASAIDISGAKTNVTEKVDLRKYLPADITAVVESDDDARSDVSIEIQQLAEINIEVPTSNITIDNVPEGMIATVAGDVTVTSVRGLNSVLSEFNPSMITGRIDLNETLSQLNIEEWLPGAYDAAIVFTYPEGIYGGNTVSAVKVILRNEDLSGEPEEGTAADYGFGTETAAEENN